jgi:hypothetical protein
MGMRDLQPKSTVIVPNLGQAVQGENTLPAVRVLGRRISSLLS